MVRLLQGIDFGQASISLFIFAKLCYNFTAVWLKNRRNGTSFNIGWTEREAGDNRPEAVA
jgi:hypothetical protein